MICEWEKKNRNERNEWRNGTSRTEKQMFPRVHVVGGSEECRGRGLDGGGCEGGWEGKVTGARRKCLWAGLD